MERIVVGIDGSAASVAALRWAAAEARVRHATLVVAHAWELPPMAVAPFAASIDPVEVEAAAARVVDDALEHEDLEGVGVERAVVGGPAVMSLLELAREATLLVVGARGSGGFAGLLLGSVSEQVVRHAPCPVVVVPAR